MSSLANYSLIGTERPQGHAFAYGRDGARYVDQEEKWIGTTKVRSAVSPNTQSIMSSLSYKKNRDIFINSVRSSGLPYSAAVYANMWNWEVLFDRYDKNVEIQNTPFSTGIQNVAVFCVNRTCQFRFRKVIDEVEARKLLMVLEADIPTLDQVQSYVDEAVELSQETPWSEHASTGYAVKNVMSLVGFYWLRNEKQNLKITTENDLYFFQPTGKDLLVTYPNHPDAQDEKVIAIASLLKNQFEVTLGRPFEAKHVTRHPIKIQEPNNIMSNLPLPYF